MTTPIPRRRHSRPFISLIAALASLALLPQSLNLHAATPDAQHLLRTGNYAEAREAFTPQAAQSKPPDAGS